MLKLMHNARIYTLDSHQPRATALLIGHGRVLAVGDETLSRQVDERIPREDLHGQVILPGLTDAHLHLQYYALGLQKIDCETATREDCLRRVAERVRTTRRGAWILGHGWNQNRWDKGWGRREHLDAVAPDHPVYLTAKSLHAGWANSAALHLAGITARTPDPPDGQIQRDADGEPTGILLEGAVQLLEKALPQPDADSVAEAIAAAQEKLWQFGLTSVHDFDRRTCFQALQKLRAEGRLRLRVLKSIPLELLDEAAALGLQTGFGDDWLKIGGVKVFMDGALGPHTAAMFEPYADEPQNRGTLLLDGEALYEIGRRAAAAGLPLAVHAIGDRANHEALEAFARLRMDEQGRRPPLRHRMEHVQVLHPADVSRLAELHVTASMQPVHVLSDMEAAERYWGARTVWAYAWRAQENAGARLVFGSDAPVESPNPFMGLYAAVARRRVDGFPGSEGWHPEQKISLASALQAFTSHAAWAAGWEHDLGKLAVGYAADLLVLPAAPFDVPSEALPTMRPLATMVQGEWVWKNPDWSMA